MRPIILAVAAVTSLTIAAFSPLNAQEFSSLEERMSGAQYREAGLGKLSDEELAALNAWIRENLAGQVAAPAQPVDHASTDRRGFMSDGASDGPIVSRISGEFRGWDGTGTVFRLDNGQVWQSTDPAARLAIQVNDPEVRIRPGFGGSWFLSVEGYNSRVRVRRIE